MAIGHGRISQTMTAFNGDESCRAFVAQSARARSDEDPDERESSASNSKVIAASVGCDADDFRGAYKAKQSKARWNWAKAVASMPIRYSNNKMRALN